MGSDLFFDGEQFSANDPLGYLQRMSVSNPAIGLAELKAVNKPSSRAASPDLREKPVKVREDAG